MMKLRTLRFFIGLLYCFENFGLIPDGEKGVELDGVVLGQHKSYVKFFCSKPISRY